MRSVDKDKLGAINELLRQHFPTLHLIIIDTSIEGMYYLYDLNGKEMDHYQIRIQLLEDYPKSVPLVWETGGRIPKTLDRHIYTDKGNCCLFLPDETFRYYKETDSIIDFLDGPVKSYFFSQTYFEAKDKWPFGQRSHGVFGILEFYKEILGTDNPYTMLRFLSYIDKKKTKDHWRCYCGSGIILRECHYQKVLQYKKKIARKDARNSMARISQYLNSINKKAG